jgi:hypothetical protein
MVADLTKYVVSMLRSPRLLCLIAVDADLRLEQARTPAGRTPARFAQLTLVKDETTLLHRAGSTSTRCPAATAERSACLRSSSASARRRPISRAIEDTDRGVSESRSIRWRRRVMTGRSLAKPNRGRSRSEFYCGGGPPPRPVTGGGGTYLSFSFLRYSGYIVSGPPTTASSGML